MIRSYLLVNIKNMDYLPEMERWLYKEHAPETISQVGPILHRYVTYRAVPAPEAAEAYGYYNWRMTEHWWHESPFQRGMGHGSALAEQRPSDLRLEASGKKKGEPGRKSEWRAKGSAFIFVPPRPTEDFKGSGLTLDDGNILRWVTVFRYPEGVSREEGDDWYINVHAKEVVEQPKLKRFFSFSAIEPSSKVGPFVRVSELWYEKGSDWTKTVIESKLNYTKPSWSRWDKYPYLQPDVDFVSTFLLERPECDFLRDYRVYLVTA
jgi:hypothetical protein